MNTHPVSRVREQQRWVLASLQLAAHPVSPAEIAAHLNAHRVTTGLPESSAEDIEASLAALALRPELNGFISLTTRPATRHERKTRPRTNLGSLGAVVILSACTTLRAPQPELQSGVRPASYFGNTTPISQPEASSSRPFFTGIRFTDAAPSWRDIPQDSPLIQVGEKTPAPGSFAALSYFDEGPAPAYPPRAEADLAPELLTSQNIELSRPPSAGPEPKPSLASQIRFPELPPAPSAPLRAPTLAGASFQSFPTPFVLSLPQVQPPTILHDRLATSAPQAATQQRPSSNALSGRLPVTPPSPAKLDFGDQAHPDIYDDLITFANGSIVLSRQAQTRLEALVEAAKAADSIQLRGRVGNRLLTPEMARQAVGRALAVRDALVQQGVPKERIRIRLPQDNDLLNAAQPANEVNRSVSIFMKLAPTVATKLGVKHGHPIAHSSNHATTAS
ncbi:OmpA family protein [Ottowia sp.]|uniref:OmpA family protein n=1 Tax=Ottowia sp. TaxID=1898956 RepID=UPI0025D23C98|nr:OmpA family protein [Ottowia sp.]MBK6616670.1 hypothetical protein [Ottowia sp.]